MTFAPVGSPTSAAISAGSGSAIAVISDGVMTLPVLGTCVVVEKFCPILLLPQLVTASSFDVAVITCPSLRSIVR